MPRTYTCTFCAKEFTSGYGMMYVKNDGTILRFCSSKCRRSMINLKRDPRKLKWTNRFVKNT